MITLFPAFTVAPSRTVVWPQAAGVSPRYAAAAAIPLSLPSKGPGDALEFALNLDAMMAEIDDAIARATVAVQLNGQPATAPSDCGVTWASVVAGRPTAMLSGGVPATSYTVAWSVFTTGGRVVTVPVGLTIGAYGAASAPVPPAAIAVPVGNTLLPDGTILLLANGEPLLLANAAAGPGYASPAAIAPNTLAIAPGLPLMLDSGLPLVLA